MNPAAETPLVSLNPEFLFYFVYLLITGQLFVSQGAGDAPSVVGPPAWLVYAQIWWERFAVVSIVFTGILLVVIINLMMRYRRLMMYQDQVLFAPLDNIPPTQEAGPGATPLAPPEEPSSARGVPSGATHQLLRGAEALLEADDPKSWREAVLRADEALDIALQEMRVGGITPEERLTLLARLNPEAAQLARETRLRANEIRHHSSDYVLMRREAVRAVESAHRCIALLGVRQ
ncbi:hypothetical protein D6792_00635 [Candidatus Parcubacteria bacterium]|jgi:hypothetical protein|nr:MAG: hypothetical protein D6792_00635 [Candidatus Parcubacteria bacterium]